MVKRLEQLLELDPVEAAAASRTRFSAERDGRPLVIHGAGGMGRDLLAALRRAGIEPLCFSDRAPRGSGTSIDGVDVLPPAEAAARFGPSALFVVGVFNPDAPHREVAAELIALGAERVISWLDVALELGRDLLPRYAADRPELPLADPEQIRACLGLLDDDRSRAEFVDQLHWRLTGDFSVLGPPEPPEDQYFSPEVIHLRPDEVFVDCGAFDGDSLLALLDHSDGKVGKVYALEPDEANLSRLRDTLDRLPDGFRRAVEVLPWAVGGAQGTALWGGSAGAAGITADGSREVEVHTVDELLDRGPAPTFIKMDIEGAEPDALVGCRRSLENRPIVAVCVYHEQAHLWQIPLQLATLVHGEYRYFIRRYRADCFDVVLLAVPAERVPANRA